MNRMPYKNIRIALLASAISLLSSSTICLASADSGFYSTNTLGINEVDNKIITVTQTSNGGLPYQAGGGYQFNQYVGLEGSYVRYSDLPLYATSLVSKESDMIRIVAKGMVPVTDKVNIFGKAGAATVSPQIINDLDDGNTANEVTNNSHDKVLPYIATGIGYGFNQDIGFTFQLAETPSGNGVPAMFSATAGFSYKF